MADAVLLISDVDLMRGHDGPGFAQRAVDSLLDLLLDPDGIVVVIGN